MKRLLLIAALLLVAVIMLSWRLIASGSGGGLTPVQQSSVIAAVPEGGGVWFGAPRAVRMGDQTIIGYQTGSGDVKAALVDNDTLAVDSTATLYDNFIVDDHSPPSFVVRPDGVILAAFAYHVQDIYVAIGASPGALPTDATVTNVTSQVGALSGAEGYTYASILLFDGTYYLFFRYHDSAGQPWVGYSTSTDDGETWSARTLVMPITYHKVVVNGSRLDLVLSDHPLFGQGDNPAVNTSIYHMYFDGAWRGSDGTDLGSLPLGNTDATLVFDGTASRAWMWDIAIDGSGNPAVAFVVYEEPYPSGAWAYYDGRWNGSAWETHEIADAGSAIYNPQDDNDYAGGINLDPEDPNVLWYSSNAIGGAFQVYRAETADDGDTYTVTAVTSDSAKNVRPFGVLGHDERLSVIWWTGTYTDYFNWSQGMSGTGN